MAEKLPNIKPGEVVPGGFTHPNNAKLSGDYFHIRDANGNILGDRQVDDGDSMTVLDVSYSKQLVLVQYPAGSVVRQGYIPNNKNIVYFKQGQWHNGSTSETVYDADDKVLGSLDPHEAATPLYTSADGKINVVYNTDKGPNTKSGYVVYAGTGSSSGSGLDGGIAPGEVVPGGFSHDNNAQVVGDELYLRDANGNQISGRSVSNGDKITVLDVGYTKQLALVQYPAGSVVRQGYVTNATNLIKYFKQSQWHNGSTSEIVYDEKGAQIGSINPYESATPIYTVKKDGVNMIHVVYNTGKGPNTKSGFVKYEGTKPTIQTIPQPSVTNAQRIVYGNSGKNRDLAAYKIGSGSNSLILNCAIHGWEDHWDGDGIELTRIGNAVIEHFQNNSTKNWTIYVIPVANPDGLAEGSTNNGAGRCTVVGGVDCNRDFPIGFTPYGTSRYWTGTNPLSVNESKKLHDFISGIKSKTSGQTDVIDLHGWEDKTIGDSHISQCFQNQFGFVNGNYNGTYQNGFLITWAHSIGCNAALIEMPQSCSCHADAVNGNYAGKVINAISAIIGTSGGSTSGGSTSGGSSSSDVGYTATGTVINVQSNLNVRKGPGTNYDSIGKLYEGNTVNIIAKNSEWYKIKFGSGYGYVSNKYIQPSSGTTPTPKPIPGDISDVGTILKRLVTCSKDYLDKSTEQNTCENQNRAVLNVLRYNKYTGFKWLVSIGQQDNLFIKYLQENQQTLMTMLYSYVRPKNNEVACIQGKNTDLPHLAATTLGYHFSKIVPDFWTGWGGDLATAIQDVKCIYVDETNKDHNKFVNKSLDDIAAFVIGNSAYSCSRMDIENDIDAIYMANNISNTSFDKLTTSYFSTVNGSVRRNIFFKNLGFSNNPSLQSLENKIYSMLTGDRGFKYLGSHAGAELKGLASFDGVVPSESQIRSTVNAFAKYILNNL